MPSGITEEEYLSGKLSVLRNRNLANVFYILGFVEIFGTGITRIKQLYEAGLRKPDFEVSENTIKIMLPVFEENMNLTEDERTVYKILSRTVLKSISEIAPYVSFGKSKTIQILKDLIQKGIAVSYTHLSATISTICIAGITGFATGSSLFITNFGMKMFCCFCNVFCSCFITNSTSISFYACLYTCRFFSDYSVIPTMIFCFCNSIA